MYLFSKADKFPLYFDTTGRPVLKYFYKDIQSQHPGVFDKYMHEGLKKLFCSPYSFKSLCFSTGKFVQGEDGSEMWSQGEDLYCEQLWKAIK